MQLLHLHVTGACLLRQYLLHFVGHTADVATGHHCRTVASLNVYFRRKWQDLDGLKKTSFPAFLNLSDIFFFPNGTSFKIEHCSTGKTLHGLKANRLRCEKQNNNV